MNTKKTTTQNKATIPENITKSLAAYKKLLSKYQIEEGKRYPSDYEFKELVGKSKVDEIEFEINIDEAGSSPMILLNCYLDSLFVGSFAFADKDFITDKYDKDAIKNKMDIPQNTRQYDIKLFNNKFIDSLKLET